MVTKVKTLRGTSDRNPVGHNTWMDFWEAKTGQKAGECKTLYCNEKSDLVGAHVIKSGLYDGKWYIIPLCKACNKRDDEFYVDGVLVPVN